MILEAQAVVAPYQCGAPCAAASGDSGSALARFAAFASFRCEPVEGGSGSGEGTGRGRSSSGAGYGEVLEGGAEALRVLVSIRYGTGFGCVGMDGRGLQHARDVREERREAERGAIFFAAAMVDVRADSVMAQSTPMRQRIWHMRMVSR